METVILVVHLLIAIALIATVLLQRSEGGALGIGGGGGGGGGFMSARGTANVLTRTTAILAGAFFLTSIILTILAKGEAAAPSILETAPDAPILAPLVPAEPQVPLEDEAATDSPVAPAVTADPTVPVGDDAQ
ncbi:MAG: preprotein translocase subunit SecG [Alphaproteobacteria bacterium]